MSQPGTIEFSDQINRAADLTGGNFGAIGYYVSPVMEVGAGAQLPVSKFQRFAQTVSVTGGAANTGYVGILNPPNSQVWIVIEAARLCNNTSAAKSTLLLYGGGGLSASATYGVPTFTGVHLDRRFGTNIGGLIFYFQGGNFSAGVGDIVEQQLVAQNLNYDFLAVPILLVPDSACFLFPQANAQTFQAGFRWRIHEIRPT